MASFNASLLLFLMAATSTSSPPCSSTLIIPPTPLTLFLQRLQHTAHSLLPHHHFDPKPYMDLSLTSSLLQTERAFDHLLTNGSCSLSEFNKFLAENTNEAGSDLVDYLPEDFDPKPKGFLGEVVEGEVRVWALEVHGLWRDLSRRVGEGVRERPELHTLLPLPRGVIIPGSRFIEIYYWDSYWVVRGLLVSKMYETAKSIVYNLISLIDEYGYVLNGSRAYYSNRSQPPLLSSMVFEIYNRTHDSELLKISLPALLKEHHFWNSGIHRIVIQDDKGCKHTLSRYFAMWNKPRPESSTIDKESASKLLNASEKEHFYRELASTAESGWDFSTRWMRNESDLTTLSTTSILPVDLNAYVLKMELDIAFLARHAGEKFKAEEFKKAAERRQAAMMSIFWSDQKGQWLDYWLTNNSCEEVHKWEAQNQNQKTFASNFIPIWIESFHSDDMIVAKVMKSLQNSGLIYPAGIVTSLTNSGEQWDFPNGWAPIQHMIVEGLSRSDSKEAKAMAEDIAVKWLRTNYAAYKKTGTMHEKYDVRACGAVGKGGEYNPQTGFGWTNGVALAFLEEFGWPEDRKIDC